VQLRNSYSIVTDQSVTVTAEQRNSILGDIKRQKVQKGHFQLILHTWIDYNERHRTLLGNSTAFEPQSAKQRSSISGDTKHQNVREDITSIKFELVQRF
jgi:hypothetical protein